MNTPDSGNEIEENVLMVVEEVLSLESGSVGRGSSLIGDLGADSLDMLSLFTALQEEFGGGVTLDEAEGMTTVGDVVDYIANRAKSADGR